MELPMELPIKPPGVIKIPVIELWPIESECCLCGKHLVGCKTGIATYEGKPVDDDYAGEWACHDACQECYDKHREKQNEKNKISRTN